MSYTCTVRIERESDTAHDTLVARVTLYPCAPWECPDPPDVVWQYVVLGHGERIPPEDFTQELDDYNDWAVELARTELEL